MSRKIRYKEILPKKNEWPIVKLSRNRDQFINRVSEETIEELSRSGSSTKELIETTLYKEKILSVDI